MIANISKWAKRWLHKGSISGASHVFARGDGITPTFPIREHGAVKSAIFDVEVPNVTAGNQADWHDSYPAQYPSAGAFNLGLLVYGDPLDPLAKLHGKGNVLLIGAHVMGGAGITGAAPPVQVGGTTAMSIKVFGASLDAWNRTPTFPSALAGVLYPSSTNEVVFGADSGLGNNLVLNIAPATTNLTGGRLRFCLLFVEV